MATAKRQSEYSDEILNLAASARESEHNQGFRAVGVAVSKLAAPIVARRGGGILVRLKSEWPAIIGPDCAAVTWPMALGRDGVLKLRAASTAALEFAAPCAVADRAHQRFLRPSRRHPAGARSGAAAPRFATEPRGFVPARRGRAGPRPRPACRDRGSAAPRGPREARPRW